jgi:hypothetical protein
MKIVAVTLSPVGAPVSDRVPLGRPTARRRNQPRPIGWRVGAKNSIKPASRTRDDAAGQVAPGDCRRIR